MQIVSVEELVKHQILPFDLYNEKGNKIMSAGEILSPGKLLQLKHVPVIFREVQGAIELLSSDGEEADFSLAESVTKPLGETIENEISCIPVEEQQELRNMFKQAVNAVASLDIRASTSIYLDIKDKIIEEILPTSENALYKSQVKMYGEYSYSHSVNVAILSAMLATRMRLPENRINDVVMGALLHDIGKTHLPDYSSKSTLTKNQIKIQHLHPQTGHRILTEEMNMPASIARVALEHHERNDGSGFPLGLSGESISLESQIVAVCNVYDNITSSKFDIKVKSSKDAIKVMLRIGSRWFSPSVLYTFVNMTNYNDTTPIVY